MNCSSVFWLSVQRKIVAKFKADNNETVHVVDSDYYGDLCLTQNDSDDDGLVDTTFHSRNALFRSLFYFDGSRFDLHNNITNWFHLLLFAAGSGRERMKASECVVRRRNDAVNSDVRCLIKCTFPWNSSPSWAKKSALKPVYALCEKEILKLVQSLHRNEMSFHFTQCLRISISVVSAFLIIFICLRKYFSSSFTRFFAAHDNLTFRFSSSRIFGRKH